MRLRQLEQEALDSETENVLAAQQDTQRLRRMVYHALTLASLSPGTRNLGFVVRDPEADAAEAGADYVGRLRASPVVTGLEVGGPAAAAGMRAGDEIVSVDGVDTTDMPALLLLQLCLGEAGSRSRVSVRRLARGRANGRGQADGSWTETVVIERQGLSGAGRCGELGGSWYDKARELRLSHLARKELEDVRMEVARLAGRAAAGEQELFSLASAHKEVHEKRLAWTRRNLVTHLSIDRLRAIASADMHGVAPVSPARACGLRVDGGAVSGGGGRGEEGRGNGHLQFDRHVEDEKGGGLRAAVDEIAGRGQAGSVGAGRGESDCSRSKQLDGERFERGRRGDYRTQRQQGLRKDRQDGDDADTSASLHDVPSSRHLVDQQQVNAFWLEACLAYE